MADPITPTQLAPTQMNLVVPTGLPSFIQMEQHKQDVKAAEALGTGVSKKDKDAFGSLIPKAFLMEANTLFDADKMTSTNSEFGKYLADVAMKAGLEQALAKAISSAGSYGQLKSIFGSGSSWENSSDSEVSGAASAVTNWIAQQEASHPEINGNDASVRSQEQSMYFGASQQATILNDQAQGKLAIKNNLDKMVSDMQADSGTIGSMVSNLYSHVV